MTIKATITEYLEAGWTDSEKMWTAIERDCPHLHVDWNYLCRIVRDWRQVQCKWHLSGADR